VISQIVELPNRNYPRGGTSRDAINPKSSTPAPVNSVSNGSQRSAGSVKELLNRQYGTAVIDSIVRPVVAQCARTISRRSRLRAAVLSSRTKRNLSKRLYLRGLSDGHRNAFRDELSL